MIYNDSAPLNRSVPYKMTIPIQLIAIHTQLAFNWCGQVSSLQILLYHHRR